MQFILRIMTKSSCEVMCETVLKVSGYQGQGVSAKSHRKRAKLWAFH
jgi:hypothetical protein